MFDLTTRRLYLCTPLRDDLEHFVGDVLRGGVDVVQIRDDDASARQIRDAATSLLSLCHDHDVPLIINNHPDLASDCGADGVHVGQDDVTVATCRRLLGNDAIVGLSTHGPDQLATAITQPVTYLSAGPIVATPSKEGRPATGVAYATSATALAPVPVFVTGGVSVDTVGALVHQGLRHFVVVRALTQASDAYRSAKQLRQVIDEAMSDVVDQPS